MKRIEEYERTWRSRGYSEGLPDDVPRELDGLAPSWRAVAMALLQNDHQFVSLGFAPKHSSWYGELKRVELEDRGVILQRRLL